MTNGEQQVQLWLEKNALYTDERDILKKLHEEVYEFTEAVLTGAPLEVLLEAGDVLILIQQLLQKRDSKWGPQHAMMVALDKNEGAAWKAKHHKP